MNFVDLNRMGKKAVSVKYELQKLASLKKRQVLEAVAEGLIADAETILKENAKDIERGEENGMHPGMIDRLRLTEERIRSMAEGLRQVAELEDPVGEVLETFTRPNGLKITKKRVPFGVVGIIYESRPNVTADAFGLCFQSGNAVILKGGSDALQSNKAITGSIRRVLEECGVNEDAVQLIETADREITSQFMKLNQYVDVLIPRGGAGLIRSVVENSTIPVIETGTGNCHIYVDEYADLDQALPIIINAKTQRIGVCNACESLVIHRALKDSFLSKLAQALREKNVEMRGDEEVCGVIGDALAATEEDYGKEYLDYILSIKIVSNIDEAIAHINQYSTRHSEAILTKNEENARKFLNEVDAACVYANASTRFTDGFEFGFGAEIGISTQKMHARGPMGLKELTSYKYTIEGTGQIRP
ncbi:MAG: glutamate-5-semialdehyde dehydrogenase [Kineothrix sp.]|nr:glutamate-5-semialdehyde dehydrogenase [Lachnospiraceae bacterium 28-4]MCX4343591.1 glutamate-5-semialdehyde dehydrogenase [Kineothrix sp.]